MQAILIALIISSIFGVYKGVKEVLPLWKQGDRVGVYVWLALVLLGIPLQGYLYRLQAVSPNMWLASTLLVITLAWCFSGFALMVYAKKRQAGAMPPVWDKGKNTLYTVGYGIAMIGSLVFWVLGYRGWFAGGKYEGVLVVLVLYLMVVSGRGLLKSYHTYQWDHGLVASNENQNKKQNKSANKKQKTSR